MDKLTLSELSTPVSVNQPSFGEDEFEDMIC